MARKAGITRIAEAVRRELVAGEPGPASRDAGAHLADAGATVEVMQALAAEARRPKPRTGWVEAYAVMLQGALTALRLDANGGTAAAREGLAEARTALLALAGEEALDPTVVMLLARSFAEAAVDPGPEVQAAMARALEAAPLPPVQYGKRSRRGQGGDPLAALAASLDNDPFAVFAEVAAGGAALPPAHRLAMAEAMLASESGAVREAALGWALAPEAELGEGTLALLAAPDAARPVAAATVDRLLRLRPVVPEARRAPLEAALRVLRPQAEAARPAPRAEIRAVLASLPDGAGARSAFALLRQGRHHALASILVKEGEGVADAFVNGGLSRMESEMMAEQIVQGMDALEVSFGFLERLLAAGLAETVARGGMPPFGLLQVAEVLALPPLRAEGVTTEALVAELLEGLPAERTGAAAVDAALAASAEWPAAHGVVASWFEAGEAVDALVRPIRTKPKRVAALLADYLPGRRAVWADRCAWAALALREAEEEDWVDFALVARELSGDRPIPEIPLMSVVAATSVQAFATQARR